MLNKSKESETHNKVFKLIAYITLNTYTIYVAPYEIILFHLCSFWFGYWFPRITKDELLNKKYAIFPTPSTMSQKLDSYLAIWNLPSKKAYIIKIVKIWNDELKKLFSGYCTWSCRRPAFDCKHLHAV